MINHTVQTVGVFCRESLAFSQLGPKVQQHCAHLAEIWLLYCSCGEERSWACLGVRLPDTQHWPLSGTTHPCFLSKIVFM